MSLRFLFAAWPFHGHLFPQVAIAHALRRQGCECAFYTGSKLAAVVRAEGFPCFTFQHLNEDGVDRLMQARPADPWRLASLPRVAMLLRRWMVDTIPEQVADLDAILRDWRPDVLGSDPTLWAPMLVLRDKLRMKVAVCSFIPACPLPGPNAPPFGPGLPRPRRWSQALPVHLARASAALVRRASRRTLRSLRADHGLPPLAMSPTEYTGTMPLYLIPCSPEFDYDRQDLPGCVHYVGPCLWNRPQTEEPTPWVARLRTDVPCVHVTEGTVHVQRPFVIQAALAGLSGLKMQVVVTTGGIRDTGDLDLGTVGDNVRIARWVSHGELLPHTDVVVTTGGAGSVLAALNAGVPLVIVPTEWDKPEIAQRVAEAGAGLRLSPRHCEPHRLRESVLTVLGNPSFRINARRLADGFARCGGSPRAAELLRDLART